MAIQKNFVIKNGLEVSESLIYADKIADQVGIGTTAIDGNCKVEVRGNIKARNLYLAETLGIGSIPNLQGTTLDYGYGRILSGVVTSIVGTSLTYSSGTINEFYSVTGIITNATIDNLDVSGFSTFANDVKIEDNKILKFGQSDDLQIYHNSGTNSSFITNTTGDLTIDAQWGKVIIKDAIDMIPNGIITSTTGTVTYYGDGNYLDLSDRVNRVAIGSEPPLNPRNGQAWYSTEYARLFVYVKENEFEYDVGSANVWVDAAPFNVGIISALSRVSFDKGTPSQPSIYFSGDTATGVYSKEKGNFSIVSLGNTVLGVSSEVVNVYNENFNVVSSGSTVLSVSSEAVNVYNENFNVVSSGSTVLSVSSEVVNVYNENFNVVSLGNTVLGVSSEAVNVYNENFNVVSSGGTVLGVSSEVVNVYNENFNVVSSGSTVLNVNESGINVVGVASVNNKKLIDQVTAYAYSVALS